MLVEHCFVSTSTRERRKPRASSAGIAQAQPGFERCLPGLHRFDDSSTATSEADASGANATGAIFSTVFVG